MFLWRDLRSQICDGLKPVATEMSPLWGFSPLRGLVYNFHLWRDPIVHSGFFGFGEAVTV